MGEVPRIPDTWEGSSSALSPILLPPLLVLFIECLEHSRHAVDIWLRENEVTQSCPTLCDSGDCSLPGSSVHGILQARILEWVAISFSRGSSWPRDQTQVSRITGRRFTLWATREAQHLINGSQINSILDGWMNLKSTQLHPCVLICFSYVRLCNPMDCGSPGSSVHGTLQAKYWSGFPCPSPGDLPHSGIEPKSLTCPALVGRFFTTSDPYRLWNRDFFFNWATCIHATNIDICYSNLFANIWYTSGKT